MKALALGYILFIVLIIGCWINNFVDLVDCDFEVPLRCEVIHSVGLFPPFSLVTSWFESDGASSKE